MSHTPAPWAYCQKWQKVTTAEGGQLIADIRGWGWLQKLPDDEAIQDANGRLIAAAPELLAALESVVDIYAAHRWHNRGTKRVLSDQQAPVMQDIIDLIAKVKGDLS